MRSLSARSAQRRRLVVVLALGPALVAAADARTADTAPQLMSGGRMPAVAAENLRVGSPRWLGPTATGQAAEVYASATDVAPGGEVAVHVSTLPEARYRIIVYRLGWYRGVGARKVFWPPKLFHLQTRQGRGDADPGIDGSHRRWMAHDRHAEDRTQLGQRLLPDPRAATRWDPSRQLRHYLSGRPLTGTGLENADSGPRPHVAGLQQLGRPQPLRLPGPRPSRAICLL